MYICHLFFFPITIEHGSQIYLIPHISSISESLSACSSLQCRWQAPCSSCASCCLLSRWAKATRTRRTRTNLSSATFAILSKIQIVDQKIPRWLRKKDFIEEDAYIFYTRVATKKTNTQRWPFAFFRNQFSHLVYGVAPSTNCKQISAAISPLIQKAEYLSAMRIPHIYIQNTLQFPSNFRSLYPKHPFLHQKRCMAQN